MVLVLETPLQRPAFHSVFRQALISASLEEKQVQSFLLDVYAHTDINFIPVAKHVHVLFHLATIPDIDGELTEQTNPIALLDRMLSLHPASLFTVYMPKPGDPDDRWKYDCTGGSIERDARRRIRGCRQDGVYHLIWDNERSRAEERQKKRRRGRDGDDEDNESDGEALKMVHSDAWDMVYFLVRLWKQDQEEYSRAHPDQPALSPLFLEQFRGVPKKPGDIQLDRLDQPMSILRSIYQAEETPSRSRGLLVRDIISLIMPLLEQAHPIFHPPSFSLAFLPLLRELSAKRLNNFFALLASHAPLSIVAHLLTILLEDLGGIRLQRAQMRRERMRSTGNHADNPVADLAAEKVKWAAGLAPPSVEYLIEGLIPLRPARREGMPDDKQGEPKMGCIKLRLLDIMLEDALFPVEKCRKWSKLLHRDEHWTKEVELSLGDTCCPSFQAYLKVIEEGLSSSATR